jgi:hypothetical protein
VCLPAILNLITMMGFMILNCILGGETLASVSGGRISWNVGIVVIALVSLFVSAMDRHWKKKGSDYGDSVSRSPSVDTEYSTGTSAWHGSLF